MNFHSKCSVHDMMLITINISSIALTEVLWQVWDDTELNLINARKEERRDVQEGNFNMFAVCLYFFFSTCIKT